jgi:hypothetical protein
VEQLPDPAETTFALLKGVEPPKPQFNIMHWRLRAQFNTQRHYEIYVFDATKGITAEDIRDMFEASPQHAADTIREIGTVFHSDRQTQKAAIV